MGESRSMKNDIIFITVLIVTILASIYLTIDIVSKSIKEDYEKKIVYAIASGNSQQIENFTITKGTDGRTYITFDYKPFIEKEKK